MAAMHSILHGLVTLLPTGHLEQPRDKFSVYLSPSDFISPVQSESGREGLSLEWARPAGMCSEASTSLRALLAAGHVESASPTHNEGSLILPVCPWEVKKNLGA